GQPSGKSYTRPDRETGVFWLKETLDSAADIADVPLRADGSAREGLRAAVTNRSPAWLAVFAFIWLAVLLFTVRRTPYPFVLSDEAGYYLIVAAAAPAYALARHYVDRIWAAGFALVIILSPMASFVRYVMPESMYFFGFWL